MKLLQTIAGLLAVTLSAQGKLGAILMQIEFAEQKNMITNNLKYSILKK